MALETAAPPEKPKLTFWAPSTFEIIIPPRYVRTVWHLEWCKKHHQKSLHRSIFLILLMFRRFSTLRMWFLHVSPISSMLLIPRHLFESFRSSDSDLFGIHSCCCQSPLGRFIRWATARRELNVSKREDILTAGNYAICCVYTPLTG